MLASLHIENIAVIKNIDIELIDTFTVLTGETGAGKSVIIDSVGLLTGAKPVKDMIRSGEDSASVSAVFCEMSVRNLKNLAELGVYPDEEGILYIQRTIASDGKSQTRLNGRIVPASLIRDASKFLINIHGQHDNQALLDPKKHIDYLDEFACDGSILSAYRETYHELTELRSEREKITCDDKEKLRMTALLKYQIEDITLGHLKKNEEESLIAQKKKIQNIEKILKQSRIIYRALYRSEKGSSAYELLDYAANALDSISDVISDAAENAEKLREYMYELEDIAENVHGAVGDGFDDPTAELNRIEDRLDVIDKLKRKYGSSTEEIIAFKEKAEKELSELELSDIRISELTKQIEEKLKVLSEKAVTLTEARKNSARLLEERIMEELKFLEMPKVRFKASVTRDTDSAGGTRYSALGGDIIEFLISTNLGEPLKPLDKIASGGELSRIMLALKSVFASRDAMETIVFDEVDTGVSGKTSQKIGIKLKQLSEKMQVLCVTHSAQIAALGDQHLFISKTEADGRVTTQIQRLDNTGRVRELARIMGGINITDTLLESARELLETQIT